MPDGSRHAAQELLLLRTLRLLVGLAVAERPTVEVHVACPTGSSYPWVTPTHDHGEILTEPVCRLPSGCEAGQHVAPPCRAWAVWAGVPDTY